MCWPPHATDYACRKILALGRAPKITVNGEALVYVLSRDAVFHYGNMFHFKGDCRNVKHPERCLQFRTKKKKKSDALCYLSLVTPISAYQVITSVNSEPTVKPINKHGVTIAMGFVNRHSHALSMCSVM